MFDPKVKVDRTLFEQLAKAASAGGYASTEEFIRHVLEKAVDDLGDAESEEEVRERLRGLGYLE